VLLEFLIINSALHDVPLQDLGIKRMVEDNPSIRIRKKRITDGQDHERHSEKSRYLFETLRFHKLPLPFHKFFPFH